MFDFFPLLFVAVIVPTLVALCHLYSLYHVLYFLRASLIGTPR